MHRAAISVLMLALAAAAGGCSSSGNGVSTAAILASPPPAPTAAGVAPGAQAGTDPAAAAVAVLPVSTSTPTSRAFQVGSVSARAAKCGYNFDPVRLKAQYIAYETSLGATPDVLANVEKVYGVAHNGVSKAAADETNYCSAQKTRTIKADLTRLLAGDYEPPARVAQKEDDGGFFGGLFGGGGGGEEKFGGGDWWEAQQKKAGQ